MRTCRWWPRTASASFVCAALAAVSACELTEITILESEELVVVEGLVQVFGESAPPRVSVYLHRTLDDSSSAAPVPGASVRIRVQSANPLEARLTERPLEACALSIPERVLGTCYQWESAGPVGSQLGSGSVVELEIGLPDGGEIRGVTRVPGDFQLLNAPAFDECTLPALQSYELVWTQSHDAWAYVSETSIFGIRAALLPIGIVVEDDPLHLLGLSVSSADTTVVYPSELGIFSRTELEQELALLLQQGLPAGTVADVAVAAVDRNFVNWARGGNFNPSGPVRVPSVIGDGTGFFGASVVRPFTMNVGGSETDCGVGGG